MTYLLASFAGTLPGAQQGMGAERSTFGNPQPVKGGNELWRKGVLKTKSPVSGLADNHGLYNQLQKRLLGAGTATAHTSTLSSSGKRAISQDKQRIDPCSTEVIVLPEHSSPSSPQGEKGKNELYLYSCKN